MDSAWDAPGSRGVFDERNVGSDLSREIGITGPPFDGDRRLPVPPGAKNLGEKLQVARASDHGTRGGRKGLNPPGKNSMKVNIAADLNWDHHIQWTSSAGVDLGMNNALQFSAVGDIVSVPVLVKRTLSALGTALTICSANRIAFSFMAK